ncbi:MULTISPECIES: HNH endonuclease [Enterobacter cloacae complex]|uniref:HNH endonuclease n=1 Tax=Enterobacter cloacae complex TaxID=354276 RepID=UPI0027F139FE|nr:HNH endonuclease [Enterobacter hormaechei]MDQ6590070.1 HNH endonuclease [Enterobacter hormaechei]
MCELTKDKLKSLLHYDPEKGIFTRKKGGGGVGAGSVAGGINGQGYINIKIGGKTFKAHRLAFLYVYGYMPEMVDHKNLNRADNRLSNLRAANRAQNGQNSNMRSDNASGVKGVSWDKRINKWVARCTCNGHENWIGSFENKECAIEAVRLFRGKTHGEFANHGEAAQ